jgi:flagellar hook-basal body complex protein FliE
MDIINTLALEKNIVKTEPVLSTEKAETFTDFFEKAFDQVNQDQHAANIAINHLVAGRTKNIHETMLVLEKADLSLKMAMQIRNKILDAYREIMRMQV